MTEQYKPRKVSMIDKITPLQVQAWQEENIALRVKAEGFPTYANYHIELAASYRRQDNHNKIVDLFDRSDAQNTIIDIGLGLKGQEVPILQPVAVFADMASDRDLGDELDYTLMQQ